MLRPFCLAVLVLALAAPALASDFYQKPPVPSSRDQIKAQKANTSTVPDSWKNAQKPNKIVKSTRPDGRKPAPASIQ